MAGRPWPALLLVGPTGSGKTPLGREIERRGLYGRPCVHYDFGADLRAAAAAPEGAGPLEAEERTAVRASLSTGALFEDRDMPMIVKLLDRFMAANGQTPGALLVLNGLPRHGRQAGRLDGIVAVEGVVSLEADAAVIRARIRRDPGLDRAGRGDDDPEAVDRRLADFRARTVPLIGHYRERGVPVAVIAVTPAMTAAEMYAALVLAMRGA